ncbi:MAG: hypothetical protein Q4B13_01820 [Lautropia sp.]|nr:hypothetical protein [Lautropia sp.]
MLPSRGRRCCLLSVLPAAGVLVTGSWMSAAFAYPGFLGKYDFARPMYLQGRVVRIESTLPRSRLTVAVAPDSQRLPRDREWMRPLEDAEARPTLTILAPLDRAGQVDLTLDWRLSRALVNDPALLKIGDPFSAVVYVRSAHDEYRGELLVVLLRTSDDQVLVSSRPPVPHP